VRILNQNKNSKALKSGPPKPSQDLDQSASTPRQDQDSEGLRASQDQDRGGARPSQDRYESRPAGPIGNGTCKVWALFKSIGWIKTALQGWIWSVNLFHVNKEIGQRSGNLVPSPQSGDRDRSPDHFEDPPRLEFYNTYLKYVKRYAGLSDVRGILFSRGVEISTPPQSEKMLLETCSATKAAPSSSTQSQTNQFGQQLNFEFQWKRLFVVR